MKKEIDDKEKRELIKRWLMRLYKNMQKNKEKQTVRNSVSYVLDILTLCVNSWLNKLADSNDGKLLSFQTDYEINRLADDIMDVFSQFCFRNYHVLLNEHSVGDEYLKIKEVVEEFLVDILIVYECVINEKKLKIVNASKLALLNSVAKELDTEISDFNYIFDNYSIKYKHMNDKRDLYLVYKYIWKMYGDYIVSHGANYTNIDSSMKFKADEHNRIIEIDKWNTLEVDRLSFVCDMLMSHWSIRNDNNANTLLVSLGESIRLMINQNLSRWLEYNNNYSYKLSENITMNKDYKPIRKNIEDYCKDTLYLLFVVQLFDMGMKDYYARDKEIDNIIINKDGTKILDRNICELVERAISEGVFYDITFDNANNTLKSTDISSVIKEIVLRGTWPSGKKALNSKTAVSNKEEQGNRKDRIITICEYKKNPQNIGAYNKMFRGEFHISCENYVYDSDIAISLTDNNKLNFEKAGKYYEPQFLSVEVWDKYTAEIKIASIFLGMKAGGLINAFPSVNEKNKEDSGWDIFGEIYHKIVFQLREINLSELGIDILLYQLFYCLGYMHNMYNYTTKQLFEIVNKEFDELHLIDISEAMNWIDNGKERKQLKYKEIINIYNEYIVRECCRNGFVNDDRKARGKQELAYRSIMNYIYKKK